jgi:hypothetical protein
MKNRFRVALAAAVLALFSGVASAQIKEFKPRTPQVPPSFDRVQMVSFVSEPAQIAPGATQVVLRATVKNVTNSNLATGYVLNGLKVKIFRTMPLPEILEMETTVDNLAAGATQSVGAPVHIGPGVREYKAQVDPDNTLKEPTPQQRANNESRLRLTIPQVSGEQAPPGSQPPQLATQVLDYEKAKRAGAQFSHGVEGSQGACIDVGQFDARFSTFMQGRSIPAGVLFSIDCLVILAPTGARATPEAFMGFRLKNGWTVKEFGFGEILREAGDWQWRKTPSKGTDDPSMRMHIWANVGGRIGVPVKVIIEGPAGTDPYQ